MKLKIPPVIIFFLSLGMMIGCYYLSPDFAFPFPYRVLLSRIFLAMGVILGLMGVVAFQVKQTTTDPLKPGKASSLVTHGVYRYTRNPMYLGMGLVLIGGAIRMANPVCLIAIGFYFWYITSFQIKPEEEAMNKLFGEEYTKYCERVGRWL